MKWNKTIRKIDWSKLKYSFLHASNGIIEAWQTQQNFRIEVLFGLFAILSGIFFSLSTIEWVGIISSIVLVLVLELTNTSIEYLSNLVDGEYNIVIKQVKDISAAAVLISVVLSVILGVVIFLPKIIAYF